MSERLLRGVYTEHIECARNDNVQCAIKVHGRCHCEGIFRSNLPAFIKEIWLWLCRARNNEQAGTRYQKGSAVLFDFLFLTTGFTKSLPCYFSTTKHTESLFMPSQA
ncbi:MAG: hypothetical protein BROFUL_02459 [Candidatus Brocadia fulgida]|uniref:Uncharacterized protein n=1 Tax=Candidatus Brocadia fulgida TaxID=380242 RepID=A0A0M2URV2_9BACT|nr:MAG: hypothetical protein BROFUL_02459 [Candidatus Brocadia fulgida]